MSRFERLDTGVVSPPGGAAGGDLGGTYPSPTVVRITEAGGPTSLAVGTITDSEALVRSGASIISQSIPTLTASPPANVTKSSAVIGVAADGARSDHKHDVDTSAPGSSLGATTSNAEGSATSLARSDHVHDVETGTPSQVQAGVPASEGTGNALARASHIHSISTASSGGLTPGGGSAEGSAASLARSDHSHALPAFGTGAGTFAEGNDSRTPTQDENDALGGTAGTPSNVNRYVTDADSRNVDARAPTGPASGQLGGSYPGPDVRGLRETLGPTLLTLGNVPDNSVLTRSGSTMIGTFPAGTGTVVGNTVPSTSNRAVVYAGLTGQQIKEPDAAVDYNGQAITNVGNVDGRDVSTDGAKLDTITPANIPTASEKAALAGTAGVPSGINRYVTNSDSRNTDARTPTGTASGQLGGTYPSPDVRGIRETSGPNLLTVGAVASGQSLVRSGTTLVGATKTQISSTLPLDVSKNSASAGVSPDASRVDHKHSVLTAIAGTIVVGSAAAEGMSTALARADHMHGLIAPGNPANVTKAAAAPGASGNVAREDHKHDVSTATPGTIQIGNAAVEGSAVTLARSDHVHALPAPAAPANVTKSAAQAGAATTAARADHKHDITTAAATSLSTSTANGEGAATSLARSDHTHAVNVLTSEASATALTTTTSTGDVLITGMSITPGSGTYKVTGSVQGAVSLGNEWLLSIYANSVQVAHSEREAGLGQSNPDALDTQAEVTVADAQAIELHWRVTGGTGSATQRSLHLIRLRN